MQNSKLLVQMSSTVEFFDWYTGLKDKFSQDVDRGGGSSCAQIAL